MVVRLMSLPRLGLLIAAAVATACGGDVKARATSDVQAGVVPAPAEAAGTAVTGLVSADRELAVREAGARGGREPTETASSEAFMAVLYSDLDAEVGPRIDGVVRSVHAELGDVVQAGQLLAVLEDGRQVARVASASAARALASAEFDRLDSLLQRGFVTRAQHDEGLYRLRMAEASLREAEVELGYTRVTAPFAGAITRRTTGRGRAVETAQPMFRVTALRPLRALVRIAEREARSIPSGSPAVLVGDGGEQVRATVIRVSPAVDPASGTVEMLLAVPDPGPLRPGSGAVVRFGPTR
jgi:membrane fusion protein, multidrug efflux system